MPQYLTPGVKDCGMYQLPVPCLDCRWRAISVSLSIARSMARALKGGPIELRDRQLRRGVDRGFAPGDTAQPRPALGRAAAREIERQVGSDRIGARDRSG